MLKESELHTENAMEDNYCTFSLLIHAFLIIVSANFVQFNSFIYSSRPCV